MRNENYNEVNGGAVNQVCDTVSNSKGGIVTKLVVGALGLAAGVGAVMFFKKKRSKACDDGCEEVETELVVEDNE